MVRTRMHLITHVEGRWAHWTPLCAEVSAQRVQQPPSRHSKGESDHVGSKTLPALMGALEMTPEKFSRARERGSVPAYYFHHRGAWQGMGSRPVS